MESKTLFSAFRQISGLTAVSRMLGFIRDVAFAHFLGAGAATDAFLVAFKLPNLFRRLTAEGALTNAFLPSYSLARQRKSNHTAIILAAEVQTALFVGLCLTVLVMELFMPFIVGGLAPGFRETPDRLDAAVDMARLTMPYLPMISLVALWAALLNSQDCYFGGAFSPVILNVCLIGGAFCVPFFQEQLELSAVRLGLPIALGVLLAGVGQMILLQQQLRRQRIRVPLICFSLSREARKMWLSFIPAALGAGVMQFNLLVDLVLASLLATGSISWLYYADRLAQLPLGLVGIAMGTALLPRLSRIEAEHHATKQVKQKIFCTALSHAIIPVSILTIPAVAAFLVLSDVLITGLFRSGAFSDSDVTAAALALMAYAFGLPAFVGMKLTQAALYAMDRGRFVLVTSCVSVGLNIVLSLALMQIYQHVGLALATSLVSWLTLIWQAGWLVKAGRLNGIATKVILKAGLSAAVMATGLKLCLPWLYFVFISEAVIMIFSVVMGISFYLSAGYLLGLTKDLVVSVKEQRT
tara:strand:- start:149 stop:1723 length:1575 start_codon:yes stop_codon:yes gene_type:complete